MQFLYTMKLQLNGEKFNIDNITHILVVIAFDIAETFTANPYASLSKCGFERKRLNQSPRSRYQHKLNRFLVVLNQKWC